MIEFLSQCFYNDKLVLFGGFTENKIDLLENWSAALETLQ